MTRNVRLVFWMAAAFAVGLAVGLGPVWAGYVLAAVSFAFIAALMALRVVRAIDEWRLEHHWKFGRPRTRPGTGAHEVSRAA